MDAPTVHQYWLNDLPLKECDPLVCPTCGGMQFTATITVYGVRLACWREPTYIGIREEP